MIDLNAIRANAADSKRRIGEMCANLRPPKMSIPVSPNDDDEFICRTLDDLLAYVDALAAENAALREQLARELDGIKALEAVIVSRGVRLAEAEAENSRLVAANKARDEFLRGHRYKRSEVDQYIDLCESQIADWHKVADERSAEIVRLSTRLAEADALLLMTKWSVLCVAEDAYRAHRLDISDSQYALLNRIDAFRAADSASREGEK